MRQEMIRIYSGPIPAGWKEAELKSLVDLKRGYSWSKDQEILKLICCLGSSGELSGGKSG